MTGMRVAPRQMQKELAMSMLAVRSGAAGWGSECIRSQPLTFVLAAAVPPA